MTEGEGQFCAIARAQDVLGARWTLLVLREVLSGASRFSDIRRGIPRISRSVLADRLQALVALGLLARTDDGNGPSYAPTATGRDVLPVLASLATWGQRWLPRDASAEDLDLDPLVVDMARRVRQTALSGPPSVIRIEPAGKSRRFILLKQGECAACTVNPGFEEAMIVTGSLAALAGWWRGDLGLVDAVRDGLRLSGTDGAMRRFETLFERYAFADVAPARAPHASKKDAVP